MKRIYGRRPVEEFFRTRPDPGSVRRIYISPSLPKKYLAILQPFMKGMKDRIEERSRAELDRICNGNHQGIILEITDAGAIPSKPADGLRRPDPARPLREALENYPGLYVLTDRLQDAQNLGSLIRSAEALGAMALIVTGKGVRPGEVTDRISAGGSQHLPVFVMANPDGLLRDAVERQYWILAASGRPATDHFRADRTEYDALEIEINEDEDYDDIDPCDSFDFEENTGKNRIEVKSALLQKDQSTETIRVPSSRYRKQEGPVYLWSDEVDELPENGRFILMIGHEGEGIKRSLLERADYIISIPMHGQLRSLNAAVAGAILIERILSVRPPQRYD